MDADRVTGTGAVHLERTYDATVAEVWAAWTDPDQLARWLGTPAGPVLGVAGPVRIGMGEDWVDLTVTAVEAPTLLELRWGFEGNPDTVLRVELEALSPTRTRVVIDHGSLGSSTIGYGAGWDAYLDVLGALLAGRELPSWDELFGERMPLWQERGFAP